MTGPDSPSPAEGRSVPPVAGRLPRNGLGALFAGQIVLGLAAGVLWRITAPGTVGYLVSAPSGGQMLIPAEGEQQIAGDGRFLVFTLVIGIAAAFTSWFWLRRARGPIGLLSLAGGSLASSLAARWFGELISAHTRVAADHMTEFPALSLHAQPVLLVQAFVAVLCYVALAGFSNSPTLHPRSDEPVEQPSVGAGR